MYTVILKTMQMLLMIGIGYFAKRRGLIPESGARLLSKIMIHITLPCVIISNLNGLSLSGSLLMSVVWGVLANGLLLLTAIIICRKKDREDRYIWLYCLSVFNISGYAIPIAEAFATEQEVAALLLFNLPTSICNYVIIPWLAESICLGGKTKSIKERLGSLKKNVPGIVILFMLLLAALKLKIPEDVLSLLNGLKNANTAVAMLSIGLLFDIPKKLPTEVIRVAAVRFSMVLLLGAAAYFGIIPLGAMRPILTLVVFAPNPSGSPALALEMGYEGRDVALMVSFYLPVSILCISLLTTVLF